MNIDDFLKPKKVRCITGDNRKDLTNGKIYDVIGAAYGRLKIHSDNSGNSWYDMDCFELVIESAENPLENMKLKPEFKVGDKVYLFGKKHICTIKLVVSDNQYLIDRLTWAQDARDLVLATQENYERLQTTFPDIEFERPLTQADIGIETSPSYEKQTS